MSLVSEFKQFAMRGNVIDMAVGVVIGAAFGKIVTSLVSDIVMPPIGLLMGSVDFSDLSVRLNPTAAGEPVLLKYGVFINTVVDFLIVALAIFLVVKLINSLKREEEKKEAAAPVSAEVKLLTEIRDSLARRP